MVCGRGGHAQDSFAHGTADVFGNGFGLRDDEQLLFKLGYRFDI
ncbi:hypothetical protein [Rhodanobacter terrae]|uniref:Uncharacterized protein n=1 Tax=Rhodanobacter terrae TaxID=418647 RepID=A0ABW0SYN0_9GAMM